MRFTVAIERARLRIVSEADRTVLVRDTGERDSLTEEQVSGEETLVALASMDRAFRLLLHQALKLFDQAFVSFFVVRSEEHTSELQSHSDLVCRLLLEK